MPLSVYSVCENFTVDEAAALLADPKDPQKYTSGASDWSRKIAEAIEAEDLTPEEGLGRRDDSHSNIPVDTRSLPRGELFHWLTEVKGVGPDQIPAEFYPPGEAPAIISSAETLTTTPGQRGGGDDDSEATRILEVLGLLVETFSHTKPAYRNGTKPNISRISDAMCKVDPIVKTENVPI